LENNILTARNPGLQGPGCWIISTDFGSFEIQATDKWQEAIAMEPGGDLWQQMYFPDFWDSCSATGFFGNTTAEMAVSELTWSCILL